MQFEVPQFIEIEDKIFGPLTWRQFLYVGGGLGISGVLFLVAPFFIFVLFGLPLGGLALALAFYPINNRPFSFFLEAIYNYFTNQKLYLWRQRQDIVHKESFLPSTTVENPILRNQALPTGGRKDISALARKLELHALQKQ